LGASQLNLSPKGEGCRHAYLVYHVDKGLGVVSTEISNHLDLIMIREDGRYQRDAITCGKGIADQQPFESRL
jgi:hypothetical protein